MNTPARHNRRDSLVDQLLGALEQPELPDTSRSPTPEEIAAVGRAIAARLTAGWAAPTGEEPPVVSLAGRRRSRTVLRVPGRHSELLAAATTGPTDRFVHRSFGIELVRKAIEDDETLISITVTGDVAGEGHMARIRRAGAESGTPDLLVLLYCNPQGVLTGQLLTPALAATSDDLEVTIAPATDLMVEDSEAITAAVRCSPAPGRNAWRRLARTLSPDHPVRGAVLDALRPPSSSGESGPDTPP